VMGVRVRVDADENRALICHDGSAFRSSVRATPAGRADKTLMGPLGQALIRSCPSGRRAQDVLRRRVDRSIPRHPNTGQSFCGSHPTAKYLHHQRHSDPHHRWAGPPRYQGATRRSRSKVSFGAPPSLISSRNFEPLPVPQVALRTLKPITDSIYQNDAQI
jgi:hypothetical protein